MSISNASIDALKTTLPREVTLDIPVTRDRDFRRLMNSKGFETILFDLFYRATALIPKKAQVEIPSIGFSQIVLFEQDYILTTTQTAFWRGEISLGTMIDIMGSQNIDLSPLFDCSKRDYRVPSVSGSSANNSVSTMQAGRSVS